MVNLITGYFYYNIIVNNYYVCLHQEKTKTSEDRYKKKYIKANELYSSRSLGNTKPLLYIVYMLSYYL